MQIKLPGLIGDARFSAEALKPKHFGRCFLSGVAIGMVLSSPALSWALGAGEAPTPVVASGLMGWLRSSWEAHQNIWALGLALAWLVLALGRPRRRRHRSLMITRH